MEQKYNDKCSFCLGDLKIQNSKIILDCGHIYHNICWHQYHKKVCPLCRQDSIIKNKEIICSNIKKYDDDQYVWIFGSFVPFTDTKRVNTVVFTIDPKKFISGFFWRIFDDEISFQLEKQYQQYIDDNSKNELVIDIGSINYIISYDDANIKFSNHDVQTKICIQKNQSGKYRPILRMKWEDIIKNLLVVGIHDNAFFANIYIYYDGNNAYLFDMHNQEIINDFYKNKINLGEIIIGNQNFKINIQENKIHNNDISYGIDIFYKQNICNY